MEKTNDVKKTTIKHVKELQKIIDKIIGDIPFLIRRIEELEKSRENWRKKYFELKGVDGGKK